MKNFFAFALLCGMSFVGKETAIAQERCANAVILDEMLAKNPSLQASYDKYVNESNQRAADYEKKQANTVAKTTASTYNVTLVFHVILTQAQIDAMGGTAGVNARINSQITVLNTDYNAQNSDSTAIPAVFKPLFGNVGISFGLAHTNSKDGSGTFGVEFKVAPAGFGGFPGHDGSTKNTLAGGLDPWDNTKYINIWVVDLSDPSLLGYGYSPSFAANMGVSNEAGVVIDYTALGKKNLSNQGQPWASSSDKGRTLVHELGHFFNLWHIWGNTQVGAGVCNDDDGVNDTPIQKDANQSCPANPPLANCTNTAGGEMFMNYMDYPGDDCVHMFSKGQVTRMQADFAVPTGPSYSLTQNAGLRGWPTGVSAIDMLNDISISPNPTKGNFNIVFTGTPSTLKSINVINMMGQVVKQLNATGNTIYNVELTGMSKGIYTVQCLFEEGTMTRKIVVE